MKKVALVGSGPSALMAAHVISEAGYGVSVFEKRKSAGRKLLIAGSSGLNITHDLPVREFVKLYSGGNPTFWRSLLEAYPPQAWLKWIESLGLETFLGTSRRYFIREMKAARFLQLWITRLKSKGVEFFFDHELTDFQARGGEVELGFRSREAFKFNAAGFCLGGGSYEPDENPLRWPSLFKSKGIEFHSFQPSNVGYRVEWREDFLKEALRLPLKNIQLTTSRGDLRGELLITEYGLEGTPIYFLGTPGRAFLDLKPDLTEQQILKKLSTEQENLSPLRRIKKHLALSPAALALLFHHVPPQIKGDLPQMVRHLKAFPLELGEPQPLTEAISSSGGIDFKELNSGLMLIDHPGCFLAGEMLNWDAPTGGFLIQGCVSQGYWMGQSVVKFFQEQNQ